MSFFDWNQDGKKDWQDDFIEYNIYKDCTEDEDDSSENNYSKGNNTNTFGCGIWWWVIIAAIVISVLSKCGS